MALWFQAEERANLAPGHSARQRRFALVHDYTLKNGCIDPGKQARSQNGSKSDR
jgi:hypothetical protein